MKTQSGLWSRYPVKKDYPFLLVILLLATFLRFNGLNEPGLWQDETIYTIAAQARPNETLIGIPNAQYLQFYIQPIRPDLHYLDTRQTTLPAQLEGRWYVFYGVEHIPERWQQLEVKAFQDILLVYRPGPCPIEECLSDTSSLLSEMVQANPASSLAEKINGIIAGLMLLPH